MGKKATELALRDGDSSDGTRSRPLAKWQQNFLKVLRATPSVKAACKAARVSRQTAYRWRKDHPEFAEQWTEAIAHSVDELEATAFKLATEGDSSLISFLLRAHKPDIYNPTQKHELGVLGGIVFLPQKAEGSE
jgi:hypothetical protein